MSTTPITTLRLSDAILLGHVLKSSDPGEFLALDGSSGCAIGGALLAVGVTAEEFHQQVKLQPLEYDEVSEIPCIHTRWPWLTEEHVDKISDMYYAVHRGQKTIEDVAAYVRGIEPSPAPGDSPSLVHPTERTVNA